MLIHNTLPSIIVTNKKYPINRKWDVSLDYKSYDPRNKRLCRYGRLYKNGILRTWEVNPSGLFCKKDDLPSYVLEILFKLWLLPQQDLRLDYRDL